MKYVCYKKIVSKVVDEDISRVDHIKMLLKQIMDHELICSIKLDFANFGKVRITSLGETDFSYIVFTKASKLKKTSGYKEILYLELITSDNILSGLKPEMDRWSLMDGEIIEE